MSHAMPRTRLRFDGCDKESYLDGRCAIRVTLDGAHAACHEGTAEGLDTPQGVIRAAAQACIAAAQSATGGVLALRLLGAKSIRAFDGMVVIVSVHATSDRGPLRLLGSRACNSEEDLARGAVLAVLDATNRLIEPLIRRPAAG